MARQTHDDKQIKIACELLNLVSAGKVSTTLDEAFKTDEELAIVVCAPKGMSVGSKQARCGCGAIIFISKKSQIAIHARGDLPTRLTCLLCYVEEIEKDREAANGKKNLR